jgi:hypothetical protein
MQWEMFTHAKAAPNANTAAHSAAAPHTTADAYRLATSNSATATVAEE